MERVMYAVIRAGGKQYRVAPGDVVKVEKLPAGHGDTVEFNDVLAVSSKEGHIGPGQGAVVSGEIMDSGRSDKILVFHFKRKKQYKKIFGHRQPFTAVRITEIAFDGQKFTAPELAAPKHKAKPQLVEAVAGEAEAPKAKAAAGKIARRPRQRLRKPLARKPKARR